MKAICNYKLTYFNTISAKKQKTLQLNFMLILLCMHNFFYIYYACIINFYIFEAMEKNETIDHQLRATWQAVAKMYNEQAAHHNSTMATAFVLLNIDKKNGTPSTALGPLMGMEPTSLSRILKSMEAKGAICREKNPEDGRSVIIKLTDYGREMRRISRGHVIQFNESVRQHVSEKDLEGFFKVTSTINKLIADREIYDEFSNKAV